MFLIFAIQIMSYNLLPKKIKKTYQVRYSEQFKYGVTIFKNHADKWGALKEERIWGLWTRYKLLIPAIYDGGVGYSGAVNLIVAVAYEQGKYHQDTVVYSLFDQEGHPVWQAPAGTRVIINQYAHIMICRKDKYGLLNRNFETIIAPVYERLSAINEQYFIARHQSNYGIIDAAHNIILDFIYPELFEATLNGSLMVRDKHKNYYSFNIDTSSLTPLPFGKILWGISNSHLPRPSGSPYVFKSIIGYEKRAEDFSDYEMSKYKGKWGIVSADGSVIIPNEYDYIDCLSNPGYFKVCKGELSFEEEEEEEGCYRLVAKHGKWVL